MYGCTLSKHGMIWKNTLLINQSSAKRQNMWTRPKDEIVFLQFLVVLYLLMTKTVNLYILLYWSSSKWPLCGIYLWVRFTNVSHWLFADMLLFRNSPSWLEVGISQDRNNLLVSLPRDKSVSNLFQLVIGMAAGVGRVKWSERETLLSVPFVWISDSLGINFFGLY